MAKYEVIQNIPEIWESGAKVGDILISKYFNGCVVLMNNGKPVCDAESKYHVECCKKVN